MNDIEKAFAEIEEAVARYRDKVLAVEPDVEALLDPQFAEEYDRLHRLEEALCELVRQPRLRLAYEWSKRLRGR